MKTNTTQILSIMKVISWIAFIGLLIQAGALLTSYIISLLNPLAATDLYTVIDLSKLYEWSKWQYTIAISYRVALILLKAYMAYLVIQIFSKINLNHPFSDGIANLISKISHIALGAGLVAMIAQGHTKWLHKMDLSVIENWGSSQFLFFAGIIYIIAQIFKKGIELQRETELTI